MNFATVRPTSSQKLSKPILKFISSRGLFSKLKESQLVSSPACGEILGERPPKYLVSIITAEESRRRIDTTQSLQRASWFTVSMRHGVNGQKKIRIWLSRSERCLRILTDMRWLTFLARSHSASTSAVLSKSFSLN